MTTESERGTSSLTANERELLEAARRGDEDAYGRLVGPYRAELQAHCYRMLGSVPDAEDALQDALLRAWRGLPRFEGRSSLRSWLYRIATNACLRAIERRPKRVLPIDYAPAADPHDGPSEPLLESVWLEPYPDERLGVDGLSGPDARYEQREAIELAFTAALQHLPARQRAVLILRDVLGFSARETAEALETTPVAVDSALQRAHKTVDERFPTQSQQATLRSLGEAALEEVVDRFVAAWELNDVDAVVAMLSADARLTMPPLPSWYSGREAVATFLRRSPLSGESHWRLVPVRANGQVAFAAYLWAEETQTFTAHGISVLTLRGPEIEEITAFLTPDAFGHFGLPDLIRPARDDEGPELTALAVRAKSHWGYDEGFLESARTELTIDAETIRSSRIYVIERDGGMVGFYGLAGEPPHGRLEWMFIEPDAIGQGLGRLMWNDAIERAGAAGFAELLIESDRFAEPFYLAMGAVRIGGTPSPVDGAELPLLRIEIA